MLPKYVKTTQTLNTSIIKYRTMDASTSKTHLLE